MAMVVIAWVRRRVRAEGPLTQGPGLLVLKTK